MLSAPAPPNSERSRPAMRLVVLFGPEDGTAPTTEHEVDWLIVDRISLGSGGERDDVISLHCDMAKAGIRLQDTTTPKGFNRQIEVRALDEDDQPTRVIAWGFLARQRQGINDAQEGVTFEARLDRFLFGRTFDTVPFYDTVHGLMELHRPGAAKEFVFNPEIDEIIEGNRSAKQREQGDLEEDSEEAEFVPWYYPIDPESTRTSGARFFQTERTKWKLGDAILFLCNWLNPDETYITNPHSVDELGLDAIDADDDSRIRNIAIPLHVHLPQALDALLVPLGYSWERVYSLDDSGARVTKLRFFKRGIGHTKELLMQRHGETISNRETNLWEFGAQYSIVDLANEVLVLGNFIGVESTWALMPAWDEEDDELGLEELAPDQSQGIETPFVGRKWVLDTAGDYTNMRTGHTSPEDLEEVFGEPVPFRRRAFERCFSQHSTAEDQESLGVRVEWYNEDILEAEDPNDPDDPGWVKVPWPWALLHKEAGIIFNGATPPGQLWQHFEDGHPELARVRITAVLRSDKRLTGHATRRPQSPNGLNLKLVIDASDRFEKTTVHADSIFNGKPNTARDDSAAITQYAEKIRAIEDCAEIACAPMLDGADHPEYRIGDLISSVGGRNLALNGYDLESGDARYPQVIGMNLEFSDGQWCELLLETFREERPER